MDRLARFEYPVSTPDATYGNPAVTWTPLAVLPGSPELPEWFRVELQDVLPSRSEGLQQGMSVARKLTRLRMRWRGDIDMSMRVKVFVPFGQRRWDDPNWWLDHDIYQIVSGPAEVTNAGRRREIEMMIERQSTDGSGG